MRKKKKESKFNKINIINILNLIFVTILLILLVKLNMIPKNYMMIITAVLTLYEVLCIFLTNLKNKPCKIIGIVLSFLSIVGCTFCSYYLYNGDSFLDKAFDNTKKENYITYYVVTYSGNTASNRNDINDTVYYVNNDPNINNAIDTLKKYTKSNITQTDNIVNLFNLIGSKQASFALISNSSYEILFSNNTNLKKENYKVVYQFRIKIKNNVDPNKTSSKEKFNIYISGTDFANLSDFNMIATVNMNTHKILLTSIPRDYYIPVSGTNGIRDNLSFIGVNDVDTRIKSIENFFGINFDYYLKINTNSLVGIVDAVGGIEYCSDESFTTTHAVILNSYDDSKGRKLNVKKGCQHLNGIQTLTVARERNAFAGRDRQRQKNCQAIIVDIFEQLKSVNTLANYNNILNSLGDLYETSLSREIIENIMKDTINGANWTFENQSVDGSDGQDLIHLNSMKGWVMYPMEDTVTNAKAKINEILK